MVVVACGLQSKEFRSESVELDMEDEPFVEVVAVAWDQIVVLDTDHIHMMKMGMVIDLQADQVDPFVLELASA